MIFIFLHLVIRYVYDPKCDLSWWLFHVSLRRIFILLSLDRILYRCKLNQIDNVTQVIYILTGSWLLYLSSTDRVVEIFNYNGGFFYFSFQLNPILPHIFWCSVVDAYIVRIVCLLEESESLWYCNVPLDLW